jgi:hypothetical protein
MPVDFSVFAMVRLLLLTRSCGSGEKQMVQNRNVGVFVDGSGVESTSDI